MSDVQWILAVVPELEKASDIFLEYEDSTQPVSIDGVVCILELQLRVSKMIASCAKLGEKYETAIDVTGFCDAVTVGDIERQAKECRQVAANIYGILDIKTGPEAWNAFRQFAESTNSQMQEVADVLSDPWWADNGVEKPTTGDWFAQEQWFMLGRNAGLPADYLIRDDVSLTELFSEIKKRWPVKVEQ